MRLLRVYASFLAIATLVFTGNTQCSVAGFVQKTIFVSQNGGGDFKFIQQAIDSVPEGNNQWIRIHVGAGVYKEKVFIPKFKSFILLEGEGSGQTSIEWGDHVGGDSDTASTPTFASYATDFMARDITFKNTYDGGETMETAVAALVAGDRSSFYRCSFISIQDTLSDLEGRHYYENCYIEGALDFIFGQGQSIFQWCTISTGKAPRSPGYITAQGRSSEADTSGFVFKWCTVQGVTQAYLGRAWRGYARVVFYQTAMSAVVESLGWDAWSYQAQESTLTMAESDCTGPGSNQSGRVSWEKKLSWQELGKLVNISYIDSDGWLGAQPH